MFCKKCGKDIDIKNKTCPHCGEETGFLTGIDGNGKPYHLEDFEEKINTAFNNKASHKDVEEVEYEDISTYQTKRSKKDYNLDDEDNPSGYISKRQGRKRPSDTYNEYEDNDENEIQQESDYISGNGWKIIAAGCCGVILICLIIIMAVSCGSNDGGNDEEETTAPATTTVAETTEITTEAPSTEPEKSVDEYLNDAVANDSGAIETVQGFYTNIEKACADGDFDTFKTYFSSAYTDEEIKSIFDENSATAAGYSDFIPGYTNTVSCEKYIYVYIAATTNLTTGDYVENTFVLTSDGGAFKLDNKSDAAKEWMTKAPSMLS